MSTMNATSFDRAAAIGAMIPPSLWPIRPIFLGSISFRSLEEVEAREHVAREVFARRRLDGAGRAADAAVVDAKDRDAAPGEVIGQDEEGLVAQQAFVAILRLPSP